MDEHGLRQELEKHHCESFGWALCCCGRDRVHAEDALQRTYLKVLDGSARFEGRGSFKTWLFAVIRTTARDEKRREVLRRMGLLRSVAANPVRREMESPVESLDREEMRVTFIAALARLPARQAEVLQLVFYHDMSLSDAAEAMRVSIGSARTHYERGKKALRLRLQSVVQHESGRTTTGRPVR